MDRFIGKRLDGRYEISELIGVGGMAVVYKAYDNIDDRIVAVKILKEEFLANDEFRRRFKNESKAIAVLSHPNIVKVYDVSFGDVMQYIVMEYINGITLKSYIEQQGVIDWKEAIHFTSQILKALQHAHEKGIVHRDIKPQNIMLLPDGTIKVTDFGIARFSRSEQRTITDKAIGSVHYISPEQARGDFTDGKADIYSVGVLLYEMTTGRVPFQADSAVSVAIMQLQNEPVHPCDINSLIPKGLEQITLKAMQKEPSNRYATAQDMLSDIETLKNNPTAVFDHEYFVDSSPTRHIDIDSSRKIDKKSADSDDDDGAKSNVIPILSGIAAVFVIGLIIAAVFIFKGMGTGKSIECPDLVGKNYEEIIKDPEYSKYNIITNNESYNYNSEYEAGLIYKQTPESGKKIKEKSDILVYVSQGAKEIKLVDYANYEFNTVREELTDEGLKVNKIEIANEEVQKGYVISTNPPANSIVRSGDEITVYISTGEEAVNTAVPNVTGMKLDDAKKELEAKGLRVGDISYRTDDDIPQGYVISQSPKGSSNAQLGSAVSLYVSSGTPKTTAAETTKPTDTEKSVSIPVELPKNVDGEVVLSVWLDGVKQGSDATIDLNKKHEYNVTVSGKGSSVQVVIKLNSIDYRKYSVDFSNKTYNLVDKYDYPEKTKQPASDAH